MKLGPRVIKTGIAVALALYICSVLNLDQAVFAGIAAIHTIQPSIYRTWKQGRNQVLANIMGGIIALLGVYFLGNDPFSIGLVMIIVIAISLKIKMAETIALTLVTVLAIMSAPGNEDISYAIHRFIVTFIGLISALLVNTLISPPNYKKTYIAKVHSVFQNMSILMRTAISDEMTEKFFQEQMSQLEDHLLQLEEQYKLFSEERGKIGKLNHLDLREIVVFKQMFKSLQQGFIVLEDIDSFYFRCQPTPEDDQLFDQKLEQLSKYHELFLMKFDGNIKENEPHFHEDFMNEAEIFLENVMTAYSRDKKPQLTVIGSSIYNYAYQIDRLNTVVEQYMKKGQ
ncbi:aromatic acid exporter family protein [Niallia sp. XMNu-256]|uniref:FUSC family protein n=1 Tax=Niallia sp. XMNu-256 TaxID=3082444 RepID=UPI0030D4FE4D